MKTKYNVKLLNGSKQEVTYEGVETVTLPDADSDGVKKFTAGEPLDDFTITPDFSGGDMPLEAPEGYVVRSATVIKPEGAEAKIAKGEALMGIEGEYVTPGTSKTVDLDFSEAGETVILAETTAEFEFEASENVSVTAIENGHAASAIAVGETYSVVWDGVPYECMAQTITDGIGLGDLTNLEGTGNSEPFAVVVIPANGFEIISFTDTADATHTFSITQGSAGMTVTAEGDERWNEVVINKPKNLVPENIAKGVEVAGVVGENQGIVQSELRRMIGTSMQLKYYYYNSSNVYYYSSGTLKIMIPSEAVVLRALLSYGSSYGSSSKVPTPSWEAGKEWPSVYISGSWRVFEAAESFTQAYSEELHVWAGGVEYIEPAQPLYIDTLAGAGLCAFHIPSFMTQLISGYAGGFPYSFSCNLTGLTLSSYPASASYSYAFKGISTVTVLNGDIPSYGFVGYSGNKNNLNAITAPAAKSIGRNAFEYCTNLSNVDIPLTENIREYAFNGCYKLSQISFPRCTMISSGAFSGCSALKSVFLLGNSVPTLESTAFDATLSRGKIFVRASMLEAFQTAVNWAKYSNIMVGLTDEQIAELEG